MLLAGPSKTPTAKPSEEPTFHPTESPTFIDWQDCNANAKYWDRDAQFFCGTNSHEYDVGYFDSEFRQVHIIPPFTTNYKIRVESFSKPKLCFFSVL